MANCANELRKVVAKGWRIDESGKYVCLATHDEMIAILQKAVNELPADTEDLKQVVEEYRETNPIQSLRPNAPIAKCSLEEGDVPIKKRRKNTDASVEHVDFGKEDVSGDISMGMVTTSNDAAREAKRSRRGTLNDPNQANSK